MESHERLPGPIRDMHHFLEPFVKQTQEVAQIRRVLTLHLSTHVQSEDRLLMSQPLSLLSGSDTGSTSSGEKGFRREYLRRLRANTKAREGYQRLRSEHQPPESQHLGSGNKRQDTPSDTLELYLDLVKHRRRHEKLRIIQDYLDMLGQKPASATDHLDPRIALKDVDSLPRVPSDVMVGTASGQETQIANLNELVEQLEKSVMKAKLLLQRERNLLAKVRSGNQSRRSQQAQPGSRLQALGMARNELIVWIETELVMASDAPTQTENEPIVQSIKTKERHGVESQLLSIQRQYLQYAKSRQTLIIAATEPVDAQNPTSAGDDPVYEIKDEFQAPNYMSHVLLPYLEDLTSISTQQKAMISQKSHLTISLAKQQKEAGQGLDRLAEESHLLPAYLSKSLQQKDFKISPSFGEEMSNYEKPLSFNRVGAWVNASEASSNATQKVVVENLEEGEAAIRNARRAVLDLRFLLGDSGTHEGSKNLPDSLWTTLDGDLGAISKRGEGV